MASKKSSKNDVWASVPKDSRGHYLEAATDDSGFILASQEILTDTSYPIATGDEVGTRETVQVAPGGSVVRYTNGPEGARVTISLKRVPGSGGHNHGGATTAAAAVGTTSPASFTLGKYPQNVRSVYRAPDVCGAVRRIVQFPNSTIELRIEVLIQGLRPIPTSQNLKLKPPTAEHPSPYWATQSFINKLVACANAYASSSNKAITVTDASLQWGGRFDLNQNWTPPHHEHMNGRQADIRSNDMNADDKKAFLSAAASAGLTVLEESNHWHVRG